MEQPISERSVAYCPALILLLLATLTTFLSANDYPVFSAEAGILALAAAIAGVLLALTAFLVGRPVAALILGAAVAFCIDLLFGLKAFKPLLVIVPVLCMAFAFLLRNHVASIVAVSSAVLLVSTLVIPVTDSRAIQQNGKGAESAAQAPERRAELPVLLHLILDEHIGVDGIPLEIDGAATAAENLRAFYLQRGFRLYADAYSEYFDTELSVPRVLNFSSDDTQKAHLLEGTGEPYVLKESAYLSRLVAMGYRLKVYQSDYLDLCRLPDITYSSCTTYSGHKIGALRNIKLSAFMRARFIADSFLSGSYYFRRFRAAYERTFGPVPIVAWRGGESRVAPISALPVFDQLQADLRAARPGTAFLAHLLLPHQPFLFTPTCEPRENIDDWLGSLPAVPDAERAKRYRYYFLQMSCTQHLLDRLFDAMKDADVWNNAVIIVHGDHGSRIVRHIPVPDNAAKMTIADFRDAFSTLFALRAPGIAPGEVSGHQPLQTLLGEAFGIHRTVYPPRVYLRPKQGRLVVYDLKNFRGRQAAQSANSAPRERSDRRFSDVANHDAW